MTRKPTPKRVYVLFARGMPLGEISFRLGAPREYCEEKLRRALTRPTWQRRKWAGKTR